MNSERNNKNSKKILLCYKKKVKKIMYKKKSKNVKQKK